MIYGTGSKELGNKNIPNEKCPNCGELNKIHIYGLAKYFHILWIPTFPYSKKITPICESCETEITKNQISPSLKEKIGLEKSYFKTPIYMFSGLIIIALLITWFKYDSMKHDDFVSNRIHNLQDNDILVFKHASDEYSFAVVDSVISEFVFFRNSNYVIDQEPTLTDFEDGVEEKSDFFDKETRMYMQSEIDSLNQIGKLDIFEE